MKIIKKVDGRTIEPHPEKPKTVFKTFATLAKDEAFEFILDHDPFHLTTIMDNVFPGQYSWQYLEKGPDVFRIEIGRKAEGDPNIHIDEALRQMFDKMP
jgi:uncharacterized protein (DUF2249 family)